MGTVSVAQATAFIIGHEHITHASLDHDLGDGIDGFRLVLWMAEHDRWPSVGLRVHSSNGPGALRMLADVERYGPYGRPLGRRFGDWSDVAPLRVEHGVG